MGGEEESKRNLTLGSCNSNIRVAALDVVITIGFCFKFPVYGRSGLRFEGERLFSTSSDGLTAKGTGLESSEAITNRSSNPPVRTSGLVEY